MIVFSYGLGLIFALILYLQYASSTGTLQLNLFTYQNPEHSLESFDCCNKDTRDCRHNCANIFTICLSHDHNEDGRCSYDTPISTHIMDDDDITFHDVLFHNDSITITNPWEVKFDKWEGDLTVSIIVNAKVAPSGFIKPVVTFTEKFLITDNDFGKEITYEKYIVSKTMKYFVKVTCDKTFLKPDCSKQCIPRDDEYGHYVCTDRHLVCLPGWINEQKNCTVCNSTNCRTNSQSQSIHKETVLSTLFNSIGTVSWSSLLSAQKTNSLSEYTTNILSSTTPNPRTLFTSSSDTQKLTDTLYTTPTSVSISTNRKVVSSPSLSSYISKLYSASSVVTPSSDQQSVSTNTNVVSYSLPSAYASKQNTATSVVTSSSDQHRVSTNRIVASTLTPSSYTSEQSLAYSMVISSLYKHNVSTNRTSYTTNKSIIGTFLLNSTFELSTTSPLRTTNVYTNEITLTSAHAVTSSKKSVMNSFSFEATHIKTPTVSVITQSENKQTSFSMENTPHLPKTPSVEFITTIVEKQKQSTAYIQSTTSYMLQLPSTVIVSTFQSSSINLTYTTPDWRERSKYGWRYALISIFGVISILLFISILLYFRKRYEYRERKRHKTASWSYYDTSHVNGILQYVDGKSSNRTKRKQQQETVGLTYIPIQEK